MATTKRKSRTPRKPVITGPIVAVSPFRVVIDTREQLPWDFRGIQADKAAEMTPVSQVGQGESLGTGPGFPGTVPGVPENTIPPALPESESVVAEASSLGFVFVPKVVSTLGQGDYSIVGYESRIAIERKSIQDLFGTIGQGRDRFERELSRLSTLDFAAVIVESEWSEIFENPPRHSQLSPKTISRSVFAWMQRFPKIHWLMMPGRFAGMLAGYRVLERYWKERHKETKEQST